MISQHIKHLMKRSGSPRYQATILVIVQVFFTWIATSEERFVYKNDGMMKFMMKCKNYDFRIRILLE